MSFFRAFIAFVICIALAGCQVSPALGPKGAGQQFVGSINLKTPSNRYEYLLFQRLNDRLEDSPNGEWTLSYSLSKSSRRSGIDRSGLAHRVIVSGAALYTLTRSGEKKPTKTGSVKSFVGYSSLASSVAADASRRDAEKRLATILADKIVQELMLFSQDIEQGNDL